MNYSKIYFGKNLEDITYQNIVDFFVDEKEESNKIEFKSYSIIHGDFNKNIDGVIRSICAFLNSDGGIIIWGAPEGIIPDGKSEKIFKGALSPVNIYKGKDYIISKVSDNITPLPVDINVVILSNNINYIYVFEVQISNYRPHQFKNTYLARLDGQTKPAPHYLIDALFKRISYPNIEGYIKFDQITNDGSKYYLDITILILNWSELLNEQNVYFRLICSQEVFTKSIIKGHRNMDDKDGCQLIVNDFADVLSFGGTPYHQERLIFNHHELLKDSGEVDLILFFGGKKSPLKTSSYKLSFQEFYLGNNTLNQGNNTLSNLLIKQKSENILSADYSAKLGKTKEEKLKILLGR